MSLNTLGLDKAKVEKEVSLLNILLANYQTYYQNLRGVHWNIKGKRFFELHVKFEDPYTWRRAFPYPKQLCTTRYCACR